jgi:hypothetical protein
MHARYQSPAAGTSIAIATVPTFVAVLVFGFA